MQLQDVEKLIRNSESETVEFKRSTGQSTTADRTIAKLRFCKSNAHTKQKIRHDH